MGTDEPPERHAREDGGDTIVEPAGNATSIAEAAGRGADVGNDASPRAAAEVGTIGPRRLDVHELSRATPPRAGTDAGTVKERPRNESRRASDEESVSRGDARTSGAASSLKRSSLSFRPAPTAGSLPDPDFDAIEHAPAKATAQLPPTATRSPTTIGSLNTVADVMPPRRCGARGSSSRSDGRSASRRSARRHFWTRLAT